ncbi:lymphocyte-specific protein 1-like isoform X2 [Pongo pygmaeus]
MLPHGEKRRREAPRAGAQRRTGDLRPRLHSPAVKWTAGRTPELARQASIELPSMAVASTKSRWETGEVQAQSAAKTPSCKDIVAGDMSKKSLWEQKGGSKTSSTIKAQIAFLQGERKGQENLKKDLVRRIKMLEYALKQER